MPDNLRAWLVRTSGTLAGARFPIQAPLTRVGRVPENDVVVDDSPTVSAHHLEVRKDGDTYRLADLNSTNGTFVNGERVTETALEASTSIQLGAGGPEFTFVLEAPSAVDFNQTVLALPPLTSNASGSAEPAETPEAPISKEDEVLLSMAVARARMARRSGAGDQTVVIMREMLGSALHRTSRRFKIVIAVLSLALLAITSYGFWKIDSLKREKRGIDGQIRDIEGRLEKLGEDSQETDQLIDRLEGYEDRARALQSTLLYRVGVREQEESIKREIRALMAEFGAETYSIPPEFMEQVKRFIQRYQGSDRPHMDHALGEASKVMGTMRRIFEQQNLPPDLAYMVLVESALDRDNTSAAGAVGLWQFTPATAKAYGLRVGRGVDERLDARKSTRAACKYIRELILDFGSGSSVMLALAAYNLGPARVKQAVRKVRDPIKQRNFWYLYRVRALPAETREYVPKVIAAMIIARHPEQFGF